MQALTVGFISLGCSKNLVDSQTLAGFLKKAGVTLAMSPETADIIIINTCAFIDAAREEAAEAILRACEQKRRGGCQAVIVAGCMVARYRERLVRVFPAVDAFLGIDELEHVTEIVQRIEKGKPRAGYVLAHRGEPVKLYTPPYPTLLFTGGPFAYLKVADGCDHRCAYCAIPMIRGRFRSRPLPDLVREARSLVSAGVREINLIAQDVLRYGADLSKTGRSKIVTLLKTLDALEGQFWLRLLYGYPSAVTDELLEFLATARHACRYLDLPIQHSSPAILRAMNRPAAVEATLHLTERLRAAVPGITIRTTCLVGFPGETDADFQNLLAYVQTARFDHLGVFAYSPEEGTAAFNLPNVPPREVAEARARKLMALQRRLVRERHAAQVGRRDTALLLQPRQNFWIGRLPSQAPDVDGLSRISAVPAHAQPGDFIPVRITGARGYDLLCDAHVPKK